MNALDRLAMTIMARKGTDPDTSWTARLLEQGPEKAAGKFGEEAIEAIIEAVRGDKERLTSEVADVLAELERREGMSGVEEKAARGAP